MYRIIGGDGNVYGPVSADVIRQWVREGRSDAQTQVQAEGSADWHAVADVAEFADLFAGAAPARGGGPGAAEAFAPPDSYRVELGAWLGYGWKTMQANMSLVVTVALVNMLVFGLMQGLQLLPIIGGIFGLLGFALSGPLYGGLYWVWLQLHCGRPVAVGDMFTGFKRSVGDLILGNIVVGLLSGVALGPGFVLLVIGFVASAVAGGSGRPDFEAGAPFFVAGAVLLLAGLCVTIYLVTCWCFTLLLVIDRKMPFWPAMGLSRAQVRKNWLGVFGAIFVIGLVSAAGVLLCGLGVLFTLPIAMGAWVAMYRDLFGGRAPVA